MSGSKYLIYGLCDPRTGILRYVGKSSSGMQRPISHSRLSEFKRKRTKCSCWVKSLVNLGLKPQIQVLEEVLTQDLLSNAERYWIASIRATGAVLLNMSDGGDGGSIGFYPGVETRIKLSISHKGKTTGPHSDERRVNNSRSQGGRPVGDQYGNVWPTASEAARRLGLAPEGIRNVLYGKRRHYHGFEFRYMVESC